MLIKDQRKRNYFDQNKYDISDHELHGTVKPLPGKALITYGIGVCHVVTSEYHEEKDC